LELFDMHVLMIYCLDDIMPWIGGKTTTSERGGVGSYPTAVTTRKPSLEVATTTLATFLADHEFSACLCLFTVFISDMLFSHVHPSQPVLRGIASFPKFTFTFSHKGAFSSCDLEL